MAIQVNPDGSLHCLRTNDANTGLSGDSTLKLDIGAHILTAIFDGTLLNVWVDGVAWITNLTLPTGATTFTVLTLAGLLSTTLTSSLNVYLGEIYLALAVWDSAHRLAVIADQTARWAIGQVTVPVVADVRSGTAYGLNNGLTGSLVPSTGGHTGRTPSRSR